MYLFARIAAALQTLIRVLSIFTVLAAAVHASAAEPKADWSKTTTAATKEGKLAVFLYQRDNIETAIRIFEKQYPDIQLTIASVPAAETAPRLMAERDRKSTRLNS